MEWLSIHAFYNSDVDHLLAVCVAPLVEALRAEGLIDRFFFVRYADGGLHLRLRFGGEASTLESSVRPRVEKAVREYFEAFPSTISLSADLLWRLGVERTDVHGENPLSLQPNNSFRCIPYEPETDRYGGPDGLEISEEHFDFSSQMALQVIRHLPPDATPQERKAEMRRRMGIALQVLFVVPMAFHCSLEQIRELLRHYRQDFLKPYLVEVAPQDVLGPAFLSQRDKLCVMVRHLQQAKEAPSEFVGRWRAHGGEIVRRFLEAGVGGPTVEEQSSLFSKILLSYLHMFSNRLGIFLDGEFYLSYLVEQTCDEILAEEAARAGGAAVHPCRPLPEKRSF